MDLLVRVKAQHVQFPTVSGVFIKLLEMHSVRHPLLEDWLIIPHFQFFWNEQINKLDQLDSLFNESIRLLGTTFWTAWQKELLQQTNCPTTHTICDRLYDYHLQLYGALYLARNGWAVEFIPFNPGKKSPDVKGTHGEEKCVLECTFVHTSGKYESFFSRFTTSAYQYCRSFPLLFCEQCRFPPSAEIKALDHLHCTILKLFIQKIARDHNSFQIGICDGGFLIYSPSLSPALTPIDYQLDFTKDQGSVFVNDYLRRRVEQKLSQLRQPEYSESRKILFLGIQPDQLYLAPWAEEILPNIKSHLQQYTNDLEVELVFSEDAGLSVSDYI